MIIDMHAHWWPDDTHLLPKSAWEVWLPGVVESIFKPVGVEISAAALRAEAFDPEGRKLLGAMDNAGIDLAVLLPLDWGTIFGEPETDILEQNRANAELAKAHPGRLISFFSIEPRRENAAAHFRLAVRDWGVKGLKLYPPTGFYPDDEACAPFYRTCLEHGLPVLYHGATSPLSPTQYCHPAGFRRVAAAFPDLKIVIAHAGGREWRDDAIAACREHDNIYLDVSGWQGSAKLSLLDKGMGLLYAGLGSFEKVMFGTDNPIFNPMVSAREWVGVFQNLDIPVREKENLLGATAKRVLGLP